MNAIKGKKLLNYKRFSKSQLTIFILAFGVVGYFIWHSFALSPPNPPSLTVASTNATTGGTVTTKYVVLSWSAPSSASPITGYKIYRGTSSSSESLLTYSPVGPFTTWTDYETSFSQTYYYKITAISADGESSQSNELSATTGFFSANYAQLDNAKCGNNLQIGSDKYASSSATPGFLLSGDGALVTYNVKIDGQPIGTFASDGFANVCISTTTPLNDGYHQLTGNENAPHNTYTIAPFDFKVDTVPPPPTSTPGLVSFSHTGIPTENITKFKRPTIGGTETELPTSIQVLNGPTGIGGAATSATPCDVPTSYNWCSATQNGGGDFADGTYTFTSTAIDTAGNKSAPSSNTFIIDNVAPTSSTLSTPTNGSVVSGTVNLTASAADQNGIWKVDYYLDGSSTSLNCPNTFNNCTTLTTAPYSFGWNTGALTGSHSLVAKAYDKAGNTLTSSNTTVTVNQSTGDTQAPSTPGNFNAIGAPSSQIYLSWTASTDNVGVAAYDIYRNNLLLTSASAATTSYFDSNVTVNTGYTYFVKARDAAGNISAATSGVFAATNGILNSVQLDDGFCGNNLQTGSDKTKSKSATPSFLMASSDGAIASYSVQIDGISIGTFNGNGSGKVCIYTPTSRILSEGGPHQLTGQELSPHSAFSVVPFSFTVDTIPPAIPSKPVLSSFFDTGVPGDNISNFKSVGLNGTSEPNMFIQLRRGSVALGLTQADSSGNWSAGTGTLADGPYDVTAQALDTAGNQSALSAILALTIDSTTPTVSTTAPSNGSTVAGSVNITANASDSLSGIQKVDFQINGNNYTKTFTDVTSPYSASWDSTVVPNGTYSFSSISTDIAGNVSTSSSVSVTVQNGDTTPPNAPTSLNATAPAFNQVNLSWPASTSTDVTNYIILKSIDGGASYPFSTTLGNVTSYTDNPVNANTTYFYKVQAKDGAGNVSAPSPTANVTTPNAPDTTPPSVPAGLAASVASVTQVNLSWNASTDTGGSGLKGYEVWRSTNGGTNSKISTVLAPATSYGDTSVSLGNSYSYTVKAYDAAVPPNISAASSPPFVVTVNDTTAPNAPILNSANPVSGTRVNLSWTASSDNVGVTNYKIYRNNQLITPNGTGNVTSYTDTSAVAANNYTYQVTALDAAGNESTRSNTLSAATPDDVPPSVNITSPANNTTTPAGSVTISANAGDNVGVTRVEFYVDGLSVGTDSTPPSPFTSSWNSATVINGPHTITAKAYDAAGNFTNPSISVNTSNPDTNPPTVSILTPADNSNINGAINVSGTAADTTGINNTGISRVDFYAEGTFIDSRAVAPTQSTYSFSFPWDSTSVPNGSRSLKVYAFDGANLLGSKQITVNVGNADTTKPSVPGGLAATASSSNTINLSWLASTDNPGGSGVKGYFLVRSTSINGPFTPVNTTPITPTSYSDTGLNGSTTYYYYIYAQDNAGNNSDNSVKVNATTQAVPDTTPPTLPGNVVASALNSSQVNLSWDASTDTGGSGVASYQIFRSPPNANPPASGETPYKALACATDINCTAVVRFTYGDGAVSPSATYAYWVKAKDAAGNTSSLSNLSAVTTPSAPDTTPPTVPTNFAASVASGTKINLSWGASSDSGSGVKGYKIYRSGTGGSTTISAGNVTSYSDTSVSAAGIYTYQVTALDNAGNESLPSASKTVTTPDDVFPLVNITNPANGATVSGPVSITANATDNVAIDHVVFLVDNTILSTSTMPPYQASWLSSSLPNGSHTISAVAYDTSGNGNVSPSVNITTNNPDTTYPTVSITPPPNDGDIVSGLVNVTAAASDNVAVHRVEFYIDGSQYFTDNTSPYGFAWDTTAYLNGNHSITARAVDTSENPTNAQILVNVQNGDTSPPTPPTDLTAVAPDYTKVNLNWTAGTDNVGVAGYHIYRALSGASFGYIGDSSVNSYTDSSVIAGSTYNYYVVAFDAQNNASDNSNIASIFVPVPPQDTVAPSAPSNLVGSALSAYQVNLLWTASTDNVGVARYDIYRSNTKISSISATATSYGDTSTLPNKSYTYWIYAYDAKGNKSPISNKLAIKTPSVVFGKGSITGQVTKSTGGALSAQVTYYINGSRKRVSTTSSGNYALSSLAPGNLSLTYTANSYTTKTINVDVQANQNIINNISLTHI